ncbi:MAG: CBS domain-containing protein [Gemmataceae bacterium]|nr:CBS domain-containing protein [Gemmataceae bacterium]MDW8264788.1 CBS domain-containing protein [Gemmataceae bacterium]
MATVRDILAIKGSQVLSIAPQVTVLDAAVIMNQHKIGGLLVMEAGQIRGIVTERDILLKVVALRRDPGATLVRDIMTPDVICCQPHTTLDELRGVMKNRRIRHVPVVDGGQVVGLVSIGDLNAFQANNQEQTIHLLRAYIQGHAM